MERYSYGKGYVYIDPDNYIYSLKNCRGERFYLYCHQKGCNGSSAIIYDKIKHIRPHNHLPDEKEAQMIKFKAVLKYRAQTELNKNVKEIYCEEFQKEEMALSPADFIKFKANMYRDRRRVAPNLGRRQKPSQNKKTKPKKIQNKFQKIDLKIEFKEEEEEGEIEVLEENVNYNQQSVNTDENLTAFTDDIDNFSNEEILILSNDTSEIITENTEIIIPDNCCLDETKPEDCEHKKEIKTLRKKMISILKDHSYTNVDKNGKKIPENSERDTNNLVNMEMAVEETEVEHLEEEFQENSNLEELSENEFVEYLEDPDPLSPNTEESQHNLTSQENSPKKLTQLKNMDIEDQIVTNEIKLEILNGEDLKVEVDKLRKEIIILKKLLIEKERIIESQEKYILLLENRR